MDQNNNTNNKIHEENTHEKHSTHQLDRVEQSKAFDWNNFIKTKSWILLLLIPLIITFMVRMEPTKLTPFERSAESNVNNYYKQMISTQISQEYPNLPADQKNALIEQQFLVLKEQDTENQIQQAIDQTASGLKSRVQYASGNTYYAYLGDIDSYYWLRMSRNIDEKGSQCDITENDICYDTYTTAPIPRKKAIDLYPIVIYWNYKVLKIFNSNMSLMQASFLTPLILSLMFTVPLFLLLRKLAGNFAAVIGSTLVNVNPFVLSRSLGSDSDILNVFFQIFFLWLAIECFYSESRKTKYIWASITGILLSVYSMFWTGWWYLIDLFIASVLFASVYAIIKDLYVHKKLSKKLLKEHAISSGILLGVFFIPIIIIFGLIYASPSEFLHLFTNQLGGLNFKVAAHATLFPNVLTTVAEFGGISINQIVSSFGSFLKIPLLLMALLGSLFLVFHNMKFIKKNFLAFVALVFVTIFSYFVVESSSNRFSIFFFLIPLLIGTVLHVFATEDDSFKPDVMFLLMITICLVTFYTVVGARFLFLMAAPVAILVALFLTKIVYMLINLTKKSIGLPKYIKYAFPVIIAIWFLAIPVQSGLATAREYMPMVNDGWVNTLNKIRDNSESDAIINSWWDFGHWFKYFADRRVTLDGSSQNGPQLHWLGKLLLTSDEDTSRGIIRMLDCGANKAHDEINKKFNDTPKTIDLINEIILDTKHVAKEKLLNKGFNDEESEKVLELTHCKAPENFLITSEDMIGKSGVWAHFGSWNFKKAYIDNAVDKQIPKQTLVEELKKRYSFSEIEALRLVDERMSLTSQDQINAWISPWPSYYTGFTPCQIVDEKVICSFDQGNGNVLSVNVDFEARTVYSMQNNQKVYPSTVAFTDLLTFDYRENKQDSFGMGIIIVKQNEQYNALFMAPELTGSMFTRMFFFDGVGLENFEKFYETQSVYGEKISTWKVKWEEE